MGKLKETGLEEQQKAQIKQRPILMGTEMVKSLQNYTKTHTRRTRSLEMINEFPNKFDLVGLHNEFNPLSATFDMSRLSDKEMDFLLEKYNGKQPTIKCPYGEIGDILYVRETWKLHGFTDESCDEISIGYKIGDDRIIDMFDFDDPRHDFWNNKVEDLSILMDKKGKITSDEDEDRIEWDKKDCPFKPSIHMPKDAARIWLRIKSIRVERLMDISEKDALAEGIIRICNGKYHNYVNPKEENEFDTAIFSFKSLWESINGKKSWFKNPWVWVVDFERIANPNDCSGI